MAPEYANVAGMLKRFNLNIRLAKVDGKMDSEIIQKYRIHGYPTFMLFGGGETTLYTGRRKSDDIIKWLLKRTGPPATSLNSVEDLSLFKLSESVVVVGLFKDLESDAAKEFLSVAKAVDTVAFGVSTNSTVLDHLEVRTDDSIVLLKRSDEGRNDFDGNFNADEIKKFIRANKMALVTEFDKDTIDEIFNNEVKVLNILFVGKKSLEFNSIFAEFKEAAKSSKGRTIFTLVDIDVEDNLRAMEYFGLKKADAPRILLISLGTEDQNKYKLESGDFKSAVIAQFVEDFFSKKLKPHFFSASIPEDWDTQPVKVLVGQNFDIIARDPTKSVFVEFYAPLSICEECETMAPIWDKLGKHFESNSGVVIAKIDSTTNELEEFKINKVPTFK